MTRGCQEPPVPSARSTTVQQDEYRPPVGLTIFCAVGGAFGVLVGLVVVSAAGSELQQGAVSAFVVGWIMLAAGGLLIALARRPGTLTVDDEGLHLQRTLARARLIPWSLVRSFRVQSGSTVWWFVYAELSTGKKVLLRGAQGDRARAEDNVAALNAAHREHLAGGPGKAR
jgi:hypothetical protein